MLDITFQMIDSSMVFRMTIAGNRLIGTMPQTPHSKRYTLLMFSLSA
jgi:hypothetical protein